MFVTGVQYILIPFYVSIFSNSYLVEKHLRQLDSNQWSHNVNKPQKNDDSEGSKLHLIRCLNNNMEICFKPEISLKSKL